MNKRDLDIMGYLAEAEDVAIDIEERQLEAAFGVPGEYSSYGEAMQREVIDQLDEPDAHYVEDIAAAVIQQDDNVFWCNATPEVVRDIAEGFRR